MKPRSWIVVAASLPLVCFLSINPTHRTLAVENRSTPTWSTHDAAQYLDGRTTWWLGWSGAARGGGTACLSCHTSTPIAMARPALGKLMGETAPSSEEAALIHDVRQRVNNWPAIVSGQGNGCVAYYENRDASLGTESVLNATVLVNYDDIRSGGRLSPESEAALKYLWDVQQPDGSWQWLDFGLKPWESDGVYYGTALAAVTVGMAGKTYDNRPDLQPKIALMRHYLVANFASRPLHDQIACLWASTWLPGAIAPADREKLISEVLAAQQTDGGWSLSDLGHMDGGAAKWGSAGANPPGAISDGYATGLVVLTLSRLKAKSADPSLKRGVAWLTANERSGMWPVQYPNGARDPNNNDVGKFMEDASTAYAVMALAEARR